MKFVERRLVRRSLNEKRESFTSELNVEGLATRSYVHASDDRTRETIDDCPGAATFVGNRRFIGFRALHLRATLVLAAFLSGSPFYDRYVHLVQTLDSPQ